MGVDTTLVGSSSTRASNILELSGFDDPDSYKVVISQDSGVVAEYARFDKMPAEIELEAGAYSVEVSKGTKTAAAFNSPYFSGKQDFTIVKDMTTPVEVTASMENSRVTVDFSDDFLETYEDYTLSFMTNKMTLPLVYEKGEYRPMYFQADASGTKLTIGMELVNVYGKDVQYTATTTIKQKQWTKLTVRTDEKGLNGVAIDVVLNDETKETVYVNIGIPDFMEQLKGAPHVTCETFQWTGNEVQETPFDLGLKDVGNVLDAPTLVSVLAGGKIAEMKLSLSQDNKTVFNYDLANLSEDQQATLKNEYKLDVNSADIKDKLQYSFDMQPLLNALKGTTAESEYLVTLSVKDALPNPNTTVRSLKGTLNKVGAPSITTELSDMSFEEESYVGGEVNVEFSAPAGIKLVQLNISELISEDITAGSSISNIEYVSGSNQILFKPEWFNSLKYGTYVVTINIEDLYGQTASKSFNIEVKAPLFAWAEKNAVDAFAKYVFLKVQTNHSDKVTFYGGDGQLIDPENIVTLENPETPGVVTFVWKNLNSATYYKIFAKYNNDDKLVLEQKSFETESISILPNADFEEWEEESRRTLHPGINPLKNEIIIADKPKGWCTVNYKTFTGVDLGSGWTALTYTVNAYPSTISVQEEENKVALIRTIGWAKGGGNTLTGKAASTSTGRLFLGSYDFDFGNYQDHYNYGIEFKSRPLKVRARYKYVPYSDDQFKAWVILKNGNTQVGYGELVKGQTNGYETLDINITYSSYLKADKIIIVFTSSSKCSDDYQTENSEMKQYTECVGSHHHEGSQLYIDDVELIYDYE